MGTGYGNEVISACNSFQQRFTVAYACAGNNHNFIIPHLVAKLDTATYYHLYFCFILAVSSFLSVKYCHLILTANFFIVTEPGQQLFILTLYKNNPKEHSTVLTSFTEIQFSFK